MRIAMSSISSVKLSIFLLFLAVSIIGFFEHVPWPTCLAGEGKENRPGHPDYKVRDAISHMVWRMQFDDCKGCKVQCREKESWKLLLHKDMELLYEGPML
ncbi:hypothetical protein QQ045_030533 [Rhodiola kirilowii]